MSAPVAFEDIARLPIPLILCHKPRILDKQTRTESIIGEGEPDVNRLLRDWQLERTGR
jgi:hypothetical protein